MIFFIHVFTLFTSDGKCRLDQCISFLRVALEFLVQCFHTDLRRDLKPAGFELWLALVDHTCSTNSVSFGTTASLSELSGMTQRAQQLAQLSFQSLQVHLFTKMWSIIML